MRNRHYKPEEIEQHLIEIDTFSDRDREACCIIKQLQDALQKSQTKNKIYKGEVKRLNKAHIVKNNDMSGIRSSMHLAQQNLREYQKKFDAVLDKNA